MPQVSNARTEFVVGVRAVAPLVMGIAPFGMVCGASAIAAGLTPWQTVAMNWIIFAGSAQITTTQLLVGGAPAWVIISTGAIVNLRFMMYSASLGLHLRALSRPWQMLLAYLITDQSYALAIIRYMQPGERRHRHWFLLGISGAIWLCWQSASVAGILLGRLIPPDWPLDFIVPLTFIAIVVPLLSSRAMRCAALAGGAASVLLVLPLKLNLIAAALIGIVAGMVCEKIGRSR